MSSTPPPATLALPVTDDALAARLRSRMETVEALLDGHVEKLGNFRMEPPSLFRGRGKHPRTGTVKQRTEPDMVAVRAVRRAAPSRCMFFARSVRRACS